MILKNISLALALALHCVNASAQVRGTVRGGAEGEEQPLAGASVYWAGTTIGIASDLNGEFDLGRVKGYDRLVATYAGYMPDTVAVSDTDSRIDFTLRSTDIGEVMITTSNRGNYTKFDGVLKGEMISFSGLTKMACCNLAESFENSASVTVGYSDAVTGARQIRMLGLAGIYTQLLDESRPVMRGLGSPYALGYTPGMWLEGIQLSKGITSVTGGHEAIAGQINLEYRKPIDPSPLFVNAYTDQDLRTELNIVAAHKISDRLSHVVLTHYSINPLKFDHNGDGFADQPSGRQINIADRYLYVADNGMQLRAGVKYVNESREGGEMDFDPYDRPLRFDPSKPYGSDIRNENFNGYVKLAIPLGKYVYNDEKQEAERSNLAFIADYDHFGTDSRFGQLKEYRGSQNSLLFNGMYSWNIAVGHRLVTGLSAIMDSYDERLVDGIYFARTEGPSKIAGETITNGVGGQRLRRTENEAGVYAEYNYNFRDRFSAVAGLRVDHSWRHGWFHTPRGHIKWNILPRLVLRGSAGLGYRSANIITDNIWVMATGRMLRVLAGTASDGITGRPLSEESFRSLNTLEKSFTYGGSLTWSFRLGHDENASLGFDYFRTEFSDQVIADQEYDGRGVYFYNSSGPSHTDTWQVDFNWSPAEGLDILLTFRYNDTAVTLKRPYGMSVTVERPLTDRYKGLINAQYATRFRRWIFDLTAQINGPSRLPSENGDISTSDYSPAYPMFFAQVTRRMGVRTSLYLGCENIANYMQHHPVTWQDNVYDHTFNSSRVWGPLMGRKIYIGVRITF